MTSQWRRRLLNTGIIPVIVLDGASAADGLGAALLDGGVDVAEVTLRTSAGLPSIETMARNENLFVGAGTVLSVQQVDDAVAAGAQFIVSPGLLRPVVERCLELGVPVLPGVVTPSEVMTALSMGLTLLKFFPAGSFGGPSTVKAFESPFGEAQFVPTGGVSQANLAEYLSLGNVPAVGGSWMVAPSLLAARDFTAITQLCSEAVSAARAMGKDAA
ncbi:MAG TPA: bifunctional 4-hydroxy-2-oxoglutarate aldolase/2-dehydro-3-deoxy-phosphogluconate aldolase [Tessaracoccus flavescens]|uniref:2-dehydro-3-deoxy-phosphogluconate aldolase n=1 Tax=Tessaracoccus flavescens TaxID=399497 RepID=A0A921ELW0_9ACTN|nr:bifunctional 4-hydroxy-2-oxoglutarate aldolase/2-dehydro-3-deoxy-phosphogluconate aldolase [Tessaracoccus flavescens]